MNTKCSPAAIRQSFFSVSTAAFSAVHISRQVPHSCQGHLTMAVEVDTSLMTVADQVSFFRLLETAWRAGIRARCHRAIG